MDLLHDIHPTASAGMIRTHDTGHPRRSRALLPVLVGAASIAGTLAAVGLAFIGDFSARSTATAILYGTGTLAALVGITRSTTRVGRLVALAAVAAGTATAVLLGILSFGPLFVPALVLWSLAGFVQWQGQRPPRLLLVTGALWGIGVVLVGSNAIPMMIGYALLAPAIT
ncbi:MAG: hypothetical protein AB7R89_20295 [Dehalococcoidia bacterium]